MTKVKICGISQPEHGLVALEAGADFLGLVFYPPSHRYVTPEQARQIVARCRERYPAGWQSVGVFVNLEVDEVNTVAEAVGLDLVQLAGDESADYCSATNRPVVKVVRFKPDGQPDGPTDPRAWHAERILIDTERPGRYGGTGESYDWERARPHAAQALLAGGLTPANAVEAIRIAQPWGVDVSSGVESNRQKDPKLIRQFLREVKEHDPAG
jgi:indole-3-glycerol phosphate synthase / phosphoribosylanthranilate isomerase